ncbi:MAG: DivIVA domain-containing protein [Acidimicrobiia bacterium]|nr:DivIVA domain-containing protein [Acidimicrobiia bacterium]
MPLQSDKLRLLRRIPDIRFEEEPRGYSKDQVDRVLANLAPLADEIERLQTRLGEAENRAASAEARLVEARSPSRSVAPDMPPAPQPDFDETLRNTLVSAQRQADTTIREAKEEAERLRTEAEFQSNALLADARDQSAEMTTEAVAYRERLMAEAAAERTRLLEEARDEARKRLESVEKELAEAHDSERTRLISQIGELEETHDLLQKDVDRFEEHLAARCADVQAALNDISFVLEDPTRLRNNDGIEAAELKEFNAEKYPPVAVEVVALNELEVEARTSAEATAKTDDTISAADLDVLAPDPDADVDEGVELDLDDGLAVQTGDIDLAEVAVTGDVEIEQAANSQLAEDPAADHNGDGDPQLGVDTQVIAPPPVPGPEDEAIVLANSEVGADGATGDPFLDELRRVTTEDPNPDDAISEFFDEQQDRGGGGWFGRRR